MLVGGDRLDKDFVGTSRTRNPKPYTRLARIGAK